MGGTLDKIEEYINKLEEKKKSKSMYDEDIDQRLVEAGRKVGGPEYDKFFTKMLKKWKINSYKDLPKNKQDDFFKAVDKAWNSKKEKGKDGEDD